MLDGERGIRCRKTYKFDELSVGPDGFSICTACKAKINVANEEKRLSCGGVWFDGDELKIVNKLIKDEAFSTGFMLGWLF